MNEEKGNGDFKVISGDIIPGYAGNSRRERRTPKRLNHLIGGWGDTTIGDGTGIRQTGSF